MKSRVAVVVGLAVLALTGCGTAANTVWLTEMEGGKRAYGGVRTDWEIIRERGGDGNSGGLSTPVMAAIDLPFSLIADTFTLPYIAAYKVGLLGSVDASHPAAGKPSNWLHPNNSSPIGDRATTQTPP